MPLLGGDVDSSDVTKDDEIKLEQARLTNKASIRRAELQSSVNVPAGANRSVALDAVNGYALFTKARPEFGKRHVLVLVDPSRGPESTAPTNGPSI